LAVILDLTKGERKLPKYSSSLDNGIVGRKEMSQARSLRVRERERENI
jgi:hypothetical protein